MKLAVAPGTYIVAVSGGVDSMVLLDLLAQQSDLQLIVAHMDHGIRPESNNDAQFVAEHAAAYGLPFAYERCDLGWGVSENSARQVRYEFLRRLQVTYGAQAIVMAHHQDDVIETAIMNLRRGTWRRGLTSLRSRPELLRPLLPYEKRQLIEYADKHTLSWVEDTTNHDHRYARNQIRWRLRRQADASARQQLLTLLNRMQLVNAELDDGLQELIHTYSSAQGLERGWFADLPRDIAQEIMASWLRSQGITDYDRPTIERLTRQAATKPTGKRLEVRGGWQIIITRHTLALQHTER